MFLGCSGACNCAISLTYNSQAFDKQITIDKDQDPKLKFDISNTQRDYAYGTQLEVSAEIQLRKDDLNENDCTDQVKVAYTSCNSMLYIYVFNRCESYYVK